MKNGNQLLSSDATPNVDDRDFKEPGPTNTNMGRWTCQEHERFLLGKSIYSNTGP